MKRFAKSFLKNEKHIKAQRASCYCIACGCRCTTTAQSASARTSVYNYSSSASHNDYAANQDSGCG